MQKLTPLLRLCLASGLFALAAATAQASPDGSGDALRKLLQERGLLAPQAAAEAQQFVSRARDSASNMVMVAMNFLGVPYKRGGTSPERGFDCSGFTRHVFEQSLGRLLPRRADQQAQGAGLMRVDADQLKPGDLVFFNTMRRAFSHVGIYVGEGKFIHAPSAGGQVRVEDMRQAYWAKRFNGARRAELETADSGTSTVTAAHPPTATVLKDPQP